jgi:predicted ATPase
VQFYDRSPLCTLALAKFLEHRVPEELSAEIDRVTQREVYENTVFFVRPIGFIQPTAARQISYADSLTFEAIHEAVYRDHGFQLVDIAPGSVAERVATVEARIAGEQNGRIKGPTGSSH